MKKILLISTCLFCSTVAYSDDLFQSADDLDWNAEMWGDPAAAPTTGNNYFSATGGTNRFRISADGSSSTFGGDNLTLVTDTAALVKTETGNTSTVNGDLTLDGGTLWYAPNTGGASTVAANNFVIASDSIIEAARDKDNFIMDGTLTGAGNLLFQLENPSGTSSSQITINNVFDFTGAVTVNDHITLSFGNDYTFENDFSLADEGSRLTLEDGQTLAFGSGALSDSVNGTVAPGTYSGQSLDDLGAAYVNNGGTLEVIPEPGTYALFAGLGALAFLTVRRRRKA